MPSTHASTLYSAAPHTGAKRAPQVSGSFAFAPNSAHSPKTSAAGTRHTSAATAPPGSAGSTAAAHTPASAPAVVSTGVASSIKSAAFTQ